MTFCIGWEADEVQSGGLLFFDAVTSWSRSLTGTVSRHPVDGGSSITDAYINNNSVFSLSAVISGTDVSISTIALQTDTGDVPYNARPAPTEVLVASEDQNLLMRFVPSVINQFLPDTLPEVILDDFRGDTTEEIQDILVNLQSGEGLNQITGQFETLIRPVVLYETNGFLSLVKKLPADNTKFLVITSVSFREGPDDGQALYCDLVFEQCRFANLRKVQLPPDLVQAPVKKKVTSKKSLGKCDSTQKDTSNSTDTGKAGAVDAAQSDVDPLRNTVGIVPL